MTKDSGEKIVVLTAGGTGGHVYPADALASELIKRDYKVVLFTDERGLNNYKGKLGEIENKAILSGSVVGKSIFTKFKSLIKVSIGVTQAFVELFKKHPVCVVGFGGYASFPTSIASILHGVPLIVHEQNSVMSRTNRILAKFSSVVAQSFRSVKNTPSNAKSILIGMPVRKAIVDLHKKDYVPVDEKGNLNLVIIGGSQGATVFADTVPDAISRLSESEQKRLIIYQQCRKGEEDKVASKYKKMAAKVVVKSFFDNMSELYEKASVIISRSGASSVYEIAVAGVPSILVPLPTSADNHQYFNAEEFTENGGGILIEQKDFIPEVLSKHLSEFIATPEVLVNMSRKAKKRAIVDAAERLADLVEKFVK
jgi:UDP-N-acetylglucosamine--N-acetylmuramyl-(pentapeptide) pyrophosphoryl-undecaprenol N-acetylglucosamine transferase